MCSYTPDKNAFVFHHYHKCVLFSRLSHQKHIPFLREMLHHRSIFSHPQVVLIPYRCSDMAAMDETLAATQLVAPWPSKLHFLHALKEKKLLAPWVQPQTVKFIVKTIEFSPKQQFQQTKNLANL